MAGMATRGYAAKGSLGLLSACGAAARSRGSGCGSRPTRWLSIWASFRASHNSIDPNIFSCCGGTESRVWYHAASAWSSRVSRPCATFSERTSKMSREQQKVVCVLYADPVDGYPPQYAREGVPKLSRYPDGQTLPSPQAIDFKPGELLGCVSGELGLRQFIEDRGHTLVVTSDKDGHDCVLEKELVDADVVISQPFWPAYITAERVAKAPKLRLAITAGVGSDHVDLQSAIDHDITVAEVTFCNSISVSEHVVMMILGLVRNYIPSYNWVIKGGWNIADCVARSYDLEGMQVGTVAAGRIGLAVLKRLKPFDVKLHYVDRHRLPAEVEKQLDLTFHDSIESMIEVCDVVTINCPLHPETEHLFDEQMLSKMKRGAYLINTARGKICDRTAVANAL